MAALRRTGLTALAVVLVTLVAAALGVALWPGTGPDISLTATTSRPAPAPDRPAVSPPASTVRDQIAPAPPPSAPTPRPVTPEQRPGTPLLSPGATSDRVRDLQARLRQIYWYAGDVTGSYGSETTAAVRGFQQKRRIPVTGQVDRRTLRRLDAMTATPGYREKHNLGNTPGALDPRCTTGRVLCIDKTSRTLRWVVDGKVLTTVDVRFGAYYSPTRDGLFHVYLKDADHVSHLYDSSMPYAMFFSGGQAVHYSSDFAARGYEGASHGCVNVRDYDAVKWLYSQVRVGDTVIVYWS